MTTASKGHLMKRGTLMVLKRIVTMALGAMGLGALAAGTASAQEIPAPDLFDGQVACSMNVPTPPTFMAGTTGNSMDMTFGAALARKVMSETAIALTDGVPSGDDVHLADILYVIDPNNNNCGAGTYSQAEFDAATTALGSGMEGFAVGDPKPVAGQIAMDVGTGYTETLAAFMRANMADAEVKAAQDAQDDLPETASQTQKDAAQKRVDDAIKAQTTAHNELYAVGEGPINMAGIAEWRAKGALEMAITGWNTAVAMATTAQTALSPTEYNNKYVQVDSDQLLALVAAGSDVEAENINLALLRTYANADGSNASTQGDDGAITGDSAFDSVGNLILPMELWDHDDDTTTDQVLRVNPEDTSTFMTVNDRLTAVNNMVEALEDLQSENQNTLMQPVIDEAVKRAKVEQAHYQTQFDTMVADNTDLRTQTQLALQYTDTNGDGTIQVSERTVGNERTEESDFARTDYVSMKTRYDARQTADTSARQRRRDADIGADDPRNGHHGRAYRLHEPAGLLPAVGGPSYVRRRTRPMPKRCDWPA